MDVFGDQKLFELRVRDPRVLLERDRFCISRLRLPCRPCSNLIRQPTEHGGARPSDVRDGPLLGFPIRYRTLLLPAFLSRLREHLFELRGMLLPSPRSDFGGLLRQRWKRRKSFLADGRFVERRQLSKLALREASHVELHHF